MPPVKDCWINVNGLRIHCLAGGESEKRLLLIHGGSSDSARLCWFNTIQHFSADYQILAPDLPGFGESDKPEIEYRIEYFTEFVRELTRVVGWDSFCLAGYSMGGWVALRFALREPSRVQKLVLVDSAGLGKDVPWRYLAWGMAKTPRLHQTLRKYYVHNCRLVHFGIRQLVGSTETITPQLVEEVLLELRRPGSGRAWGSFLKNELRPSGFRSDCRDSLSRVTAPCQIIHGEEDPLIPAETARAAHRLIPDSRLFILPGCGHWPQKEKPEEFLRILEDFLGPGSQR
jgi:pimeloyl-ACP methyl ester carboxylesterase